VERLGLPVVPLGAAAAPCLAPEKLMTAAWRRNLDRLRALAPESSPFGGSAGAARAEALLRQLEFGFDLRAGPGGLALPGARVARNLPTASGDAEEAFILDDMRAEVLAGRRAGPFLAPPFPDFVASPLGTVPKKSGKLRLIHHLSHPRRCPELSVNARLEDVDCGYLRFEEAVALVARRGHGTLMAKHDVRAAFRHLRVRPDQQYALGMSFLGLYFYERCLSFGLKPAPRLYEEVATAANECARWNLRLDELGAALVHYLDDSFAVFGTDPAEAARIDALIHGLMLELGFDMADDKRVRPTTCLELLGLKIDSVAWRVSLPADKLRDYRASVAALLEAPDASAGELRSLLGKLAFAARAVRHGRVFYLRLLRALRGKEEPRERIALGAGLRADLRWWHRFMAEWNGVSLLPPSFSDWPAAHVYTLFSDACGSGMGAWFPARREYAQHSWTTLELEWARERGRRAAPPGVPDDQGDSTGQARGEESFSRGAWATAGDARALSMPLLELYALVLAVHTWRRELAGKPVRFRCDALAAVNAVNRGRSGVRGMAALLRVLVSVTARYEIFLAVDHIPGAQNEWADLLSRTNDDSRFLCLLQERERCAQAAGGAVGSPPTSCPGRRSIHCDLTAHCFD
jgi:hypothetical protein